MSNRLAISVVGVTETASHGTLYVPTDPKGQSYGDHETLWPLPKTEPDGSVDGGGAGDRLGGEPLGPFQC